jgi:DNA modification methylase
VGGDGVTVDLRLGDCLEILPTLADKSVDAVITDPPYGINFINGGGRNPKNGWRTFYDNEGDWDKWKPTKEYFDHMLRIGKVVIIWGGNYFSDCLPPSQQWLVWDKGQRDFSLADGELAWSSQDKAVRMFTYSRAAMLKERVEHPTQKPVALMKWCIEIAKAQNILDPFMGSGSTGVAAAQLGCDFTGIEINPKYHAIAEKRIKAAQMQTVMEFA